MQDDDFVNIFRNSLLKQNVKKNIPLYNEDKSSNITNVSAKDVILNISQQVKAIQTADNVKKVKHKKELSEYRKNNFIPVSMISNNQPPKPVQTSKFDTQCVSDTQLIDIIEQAEALMDVETDINQEFNNNFHDDTYTLDNNNQEQAVKFCSTTTDVEAFKNNLNCNISEPISNKNNNSFTTKVEEISKPVSDLCLDKNIISQLDNETESKHSSFNIICDYNEERSKSPILNNFHSPIVKSKSPSPLVFGLESFERFEAIAMPVVEGNLETSIAKELIHSQIVSDELYIQRHTEPVSIDRDKSLSPILNIKKKSTDNNIKNDTITKIKNGVLTIEDSILFSSDEENEFKNDEIPLTCALKTSFYNEHDLNETMYVGFQTASNKSIQICSDSYNKAKFLLDEKGADISLTKLVEIMDGSHSVKDKNIQKELNESIFNNNNNILDSAINSETVLNKTGHICNKKSVWDKPTEAFAYKENNLPLSLNRGNKIEAKDTILGNKEKISDVPCLETDQFNIDDNIIKEFETNFLETDDFLNKEHNLTNFNLGNKNAVPKESSICQDNNIFEGFKTASKKEIKLNTHKLDSVRNIFKDIDLTDVKLDVAKEHDHIENDVNSTDIYSSSKTFIGFKTASNKSIKISDQALASTKKVFQDIGNEDILAHKLNKESQNVLEKKNKIKEKLLKQAYPDSNEDFKQTTDNAKEISQFVGFQTANNKPVAVSEEALAKSKKIFQDIDKEISPINENFSKTVNNKLKGCQSANNKEMSISKNALLKSNSILDDIKVCKMDIPISDNCQSIEKFQGFKSASNKPVQISAESLARTKNIFQDIDLSENNENKDQKNTLNYNINSKISVGFQTASNKPVAISNEALAKTKKIFNDIDNINASTSKSLEFENKFGGFKTASNKIVKISEKALSKSKNIFKDIEINDNFETSFDNNEMKTIFDGFKTGNSKPVHVSEAALIKSKDLFKDVEGSEISSKGNSSAKYNIFSGFQTASNKKVEVSEKALIKSRKLLEDINFKEDDFVKIASNDVILKKSLPDIVNNKMIKKYNKINNENNINIEDLMNTEVIKDLEESLCTEDFYAERTTTSKRSSSPILSCPRAKKRKKFEMPKSIKPVTAVRNEDNKNSNAIFTFDPNYKKHKRFNLLNLNEIENQNESNTEIDPNISKFQFDTLLQFKFGGNRNDIDIDNDIWTTDKIAQLFTDSVNKKIIPKGWIENHLKLIIWKLLSYEIVFPKSMKNVCTITNVLHQLKYRYDRELYNVERPALRKILEKDEISSKIIILCVIGVYVDGTYVDSIANPTQNLELLLTDGWYTIMASTDVMLNKLIFDGKITVGTKLVIHGAELLNCEQGVSPWEDTSKIRLKIFGNSTRRAKWNARLGFHSNGAILSHLSAVRLEGGKVSRVKVFVSRVYPMLYVERLEDGSTVTRSERLENLYQIKYENEKQNQLEKLYEEVEKYSDKESQDSESLDTERDLDSGTQLCKLMKRCRDPAEFRAGLTSSQLNLIQEHSSKKRDILIEKLQRKIQDLVKKRGLDLNRNVVPLLKIRVADFNNKLNVINKAMITIWRPNESLLDLIKEGSWIEIFNIVPTSVRYSEIQLSAGRQSIFKKAKIKENGNLKSITQTLKRKPYTIKDLQNPFTTDYNEIDTCGFIFLIEPPIKEYEGSKQLFQNVYISDEYRNVIGINFWGGIKKFGFESILNIGEVISCVNLQRRHGNIKKCLPQFRATEFTYFTKTCKIDVLRNMTDEFSKILSNINKKQFIEECLKAKNSFTNLKHGNTDFSPYRLNNSEYNMTKNKIFIDSPNNNECVDENLTGLDFESSFTETTVKRKRKVNERIAKLEMYGEPPPLQPIHIINKSNIIHNSYKSPLLVKDKMNNIKSVASIKKLPENMSSPICLNRTYVKNINPVKLIFSNNNNDDSEDPFAEEFDASPPLSLG